MSEFVVTNNEIEGQVYIPLDPEISKFKKPKKLKITIYYTDGESETFKVRWWDASGQTFCFAEKSPNRVVMIPWHVIDQIFAERVE